jgi:hypothetical protein
VALQKPEKQYSMGCKLDKDMCGLCGKKDCEHLLLNIKNRGPIKVGGTLEHPLFYELPPPLVITEPADKSGDPTFIRQNTKYQKDTICQN